MRARRTPAFRARKRYELRCEARASRTLRRYGYCEADKWSDREAADARELLDSLKAVKSQNLWKTESLKFESLNLMK